MSKESDPQKTFGRNLREARTRAGMSQREVAEKLGISRDIIGRFERGITWPSITNLHHLCDMLKVSADTLFGFDASEGPSVRAQPPEDPPQLRRVMRALRKARPNVLRIVEVLLDEIEKHERL